MPSTQGVSAVQLAWVRTGSRLVHVSRFAGRAVAERPETCCPVCMEPVILRLGEQRAHHAAHRADSACALAGGESALHLNAKCHVAEQLARGGTLVVRLRCAERHHDESTGRRVRCSAVHDVELVAGAERCRVETAAAATRPDILLYRDGRPAAALEVLVSHRVDGEKMRRLAALGLPWAEVRASAVARGEWGWRPDRPLPVERTGDIAEWRCSAHAARRAAADRSRANGFRPWLARTVDAWHPDGRRERDAVYMEAELRGGRVAAVRLMHVLDDDVIARDGRPSRTATRQRLHAEFVRWVKRQRAAGTIVESPDGWCVARRVTLDAAQLRAACALDASPYRYDRAAGRWVRKDSRRR